MDKHLVFLVKQTERYTSLLAKNLESGGSVGSLKLATRSSTSLSSNSKKRARPHQPSTEIATDIHIFQKRHATENSINTCCEYIFFPVIFIFFYYKYKIIFVSV
jgi:hypothetical protein